MMRNPFTGTLRGKIVLTVIFLFFVTAPLTMFIALKIYSDSFQEAIAAYRRSPAPEVAAAVDRDALSAEAYRPLRQAETQVWFLVVCFGVIITGSLWWMMKYLTGPLVRMTSAISDLNDDAGFTPLRFETGDEIQSLADAFDRMMLMLYGRKAELEKNRALFQ
ncbi:MAG TPA: hypothetical protein VF799_05070, partial [Geobacteraceae bacterium]